MTYTATRGIRRSRSHGHRARGLLTAVLVVVILLIAADFAARAVAESVMATKIEHDGDLSAKPDVGIDGFPFLTQVAAKDFERVTIATSNLTAGPVTITSVDVTASAIRLDSYAFSSGTIGSLSGTAFISFPSLASTLTHQVGPLGSLLNGAGLRLTAAGPDEVEASLNGLGSATWQVTRLSGDSLSIRLVGSSDVPAILLSSIQNMKIQLPKLPLGLTVNSVGVTQQGVVGRVSGQNVPFGS